MKKRRAKSPPFPKSSPAPKSPQPSPPTKSSAPLRSSPRAAAAPTPLIRAPKTSPLVAILTSHWLLWTVLFFGLACRFYGIRWDEGAQLHPDERFCVTIVERLRWPHSPGGFFDSRVSPLNPALLPRTEYVYGQLPLFTLKLVADAVGIREAPGLFFVGRFLAALFDCGTVGLTFLIARRLFEAPKALFCAALVACAALHIQQSHFFVVDPFAAFWVVASFWAGMRLLELGRARDALWTGAFFGAALACKISAALFGVALLGWVWLLARRYGLNRAFFCGLLVLGMASLLFRLAHPMAFLGEWGFFDVRPYPRFWRDVAMQSGITRGVVDVPFNVQWIGRAPLGFSLRNLGSWGYGWPFLLSAGAGIALLLRRPRGQGALWVATVFALALLGFYGAAFSKFTRYFLPLTPFCALLAGHAWRELEKRSPKLRVGAPLVALGAAVWAGCVTSIYARPHPRIAASRWIERHIPFATVVANETAWDEGLPLGNIGVFNPVASLDLDVYAPDSAGKVAALADKLDQAEWIFLSSGRAWQNIPRWPQKWPITTRYYRALFDGSLGFGLEKQFVSFPRLGPWQFPDVRAEEALTVYDHPVVLLFRKTKAYDPAQTRQILNRIAPPKPQRWRPNLAAKIDERALPTPPGF